MVFNATVNTISVILWWSVLLLEENGETDHHNITETLLKVALNTIKQTNQIYQKIHVIHSINIQ
jgi:hypothetical protein